MAFVPKPNQCGLFVNKRAPEKSDYTAQIEIECPKCHQISSFWMSGWKKVSQNGLKYLSLALRPKGAAHPGRQDDAQVHDGDGVF